MTRSEALQVAKPILFNTEMVRAIQNGTKTVTRRPVKFLDNRNPNWSGYFKDGLMLYNGNNEPCSEKPPYKVGDILYVREKWCRIECENCDGDVLTGEPLSDDCPDETGGCYRYRASCEIGGDARWRPSIHMPKEAARIFLRVTGVRVERLQDITITGLQEEGILNDGYISQYAAMTTTAFEDFKDLWDSAIKKSELEKYGWNANPWVWVIEFERLEFTE